MKDKETVRVTNVELAAFLLHRGHKLQTVESEQPGSKYCAWVFLGSEQDVMPFYGSDEERLMFQLRAARRMARQFTTDREHDYHNKKETTYHEPIPK